VTRGVPTGGAQNWSTKRMGVGGGGGGGQSKKRKTGAASWIEEDRSRFVTGKGLNDKKKSRRRRLGGRKDTAVGRGVGRLSVRIWKKKGG